MNASGKFLLVPCLLFLATTPLAAQAKKSYALIKPTDTPAEIIRAAADVVPTPEQYAWQKMGFNAFVHFGMNTFADKHPGKESPRLFDPVDLNCDQWVRLFKEAGMKMAILTVKHADGFCLWPSRYTAYSVRSSPWKDGKGDVFRQFVNACHKYGLKVGFYLSPWDQNNPAYGTPAYNTYYMNQLRELLTNYGKITEVWFDGYTGPNAPKQVYDWDAYYRLVRKLQPKALIAVMGPDIRWVGTESGYGRDTEWDVLPIDLSGLNQNEIETEPDPIYNIFKPRNYMGRDLGGRDKLAGAGGLFWYPSEADVSIRPGWFYHASQDTAVKSAAELVDIYFNSVGKNSVLLLNVPPDRRGFISKYDIGPLMRMHKILSQTFAQNYAQYAAVDIDGSRKAVDEVKLFGGGKYWQAKEGSDTATLQFNFPKKQTFDVAMLQEEIRVGQRIGRFRLDYWTGNRWKRLTGGTTVGYKRLLRFQPVSTRHVRLIIEKSRLNPTLANFGLYYLPLRYLGNR